MSAPDWQTITRALGDYTHAPGPPGTPRAAVALLLRDGERGPELLFIRRAEHERDPWSGHVGFPGGRAEPVDASLQATAVRETWEEVGLDLEREARLLGRLDEIPAMARGRPVDLVIAPFVFQVLERVEGAPSLEVVGVHWLPLELLLDPASRSMLERVHEGTVVQLRCLRVQGLVVWGLTYRMFENLAAVLGGTA